MKTKTVRQSAGKSTRKSRSQSLQEMIVQAQKQPGVKEVMEVFEKSRATEQIILTAWGQVSAPRHLSITNGSLPVEW